jgi:glycosyltransferase involved in cell wall biosynthesis
VRVLQIPYVYTPDSLGGTEVYVRSLANELKQFNVDSSIAVFSPLAEFETIDGIDVYRCHYPTDYAQIYGSVAPDAVAAWLAIVELAKPDLVHFHARNPALHSEVVKAIQARGVPVLYTSHLPTYCLRGSLMYKGKEPCLQGPSLARCHECLFERRGVAPSLSGVLRTLDPLINIAQGLLPRKGKQLALYHRDIDGFLQESRAFLSSVDQVVAVCEWINAQIEPLSANNMVLNRQGLRSDFAGDAQQISALPSSPSALAKTNLRVLALGRADPTKNFHRLMEAVVSSHLPISLTLCAAQTDNEHFDVLKALAAKAPERIQILTDVSGAALAACFAQADILAVPSNWMETGPLVVLEAFAHKLPVVGANLGGIAELVRDGVDGWLLPATDVDAWREKLEHLALHPLDVQRAREQIKPVRTMRDVAREHAEQIYPKLLTRA